jgi:hypothetical protein
MKKITKKDSIAKIASMVGKNITIPKRYEEVVTPQEISLAKTEII